MENIPSWGQSRKITIRFKLSGNMLPQEKYFYNVLIIGLKACMDFDLWFWYGLIRKWDVPKICHWTWNLEQVLPIVDYGTAAKFTRNDRVSETGFASQWQCLEVGLKMGMDHVYIWKRLRKFHFLIWDWIWEPIIRVKISIGNHIISRAIWNKWARVNFFKD